MLPARNKLSTANTMMPNELFGMFGIDIPMPTQEESNRFKNIFQNAFLNNDTPNDLEGTIHNFLGDILNETKPKEDVIIHKKDIDIKDIYENVYLGDILNEDDLGHIHCADVELGTEQIFRVTCGSKNKVYKITLDLKHTSCFTIYNGYLCYTINITLKEALCGFTHEFIHLNGKEYKLNNSKTIINDKSEIKLPNLGIKKNDSHDALIIRFNIKFPTSLNEQQKDSLNHILDNDVE